MIERRGRNAVKQESGDVYVSVDEGGKRRGKEEERETEGDGKGEKML